MKYLITFNESQTWHDKFIELNRFCENYLAYLECNIDFEYINRTKSKQDIFKIIIKSDDIFVWDDIKDMVIPFFTVLNNTYYIIPLRVINPGFKDDVSVTFIRNYLKFRCSVDDIINDNLESVVDINNSRNPIMFQSNLKFNIINFYVCI